ncbi:MAG: hypothetical protein DRZ82_00375 [Thermoprotei archaeon]|nr:MAG: hypothetical protein DRZ82_00375 [Thermoprotei archaeon]
MPKSVSKVITLTISYLKCLHLSYKSFDIRERARRHIFRRTTNTELILIYVWQLFEILMIGSKLSGGE